MTKGERIVSKRKEVEHSDAVKEQARALFMSGENCAEVARKIGVPYTTVKTWEKKWEKESIDEDGNTLVEIRKRKKEEFAERAWDIIDKANDLLERRIDRALECEDEIDTIIDEVMDAGKEDLSDGAKKAIFYKLRSIKVDDIREIATVIGTIYDKQALANKEATSIVEGGIQVEFNIPRPPKDENES
jgi:transposase-like protein